MFVYFYVLLCLIWRLMPLINCIFLHISLFSTIFLCFLFSLSFVAIVSYCPYYSSSHASVKVREGSNYWGPLGYEALMSPKSSQSPDPRTTSKRACMFKFRKRKDSKIPLYQGQKRWDIVIYLYVLKEGTREIHLTQFAVSFLGSRKLSTSVLLIYSFAPVTLRWQVA